MARESADVDLIEIFGLSAEEIASLGLAPSAPPLVRPDAPAPPTLPVEPQQARRATALPRQTRDAGARPTAPAPARRAVAPLADDLALLAMLDSEADAIDAPAGFAGGQSLRPATTDMAPPRSAPRVTDADVDAGRGAQGADAPAPAETGDTVASHAARRGSFRFVRVSKPTPPAPAGEAAAETWPAAGDALPSSSPAEDEDIDLAALFGLSSEESLALGLAAPLPTDVAPKPGPEGQGQGPDPERSGQRIPALESAWQGPDPEGSGQRTTQVENPELPATPALQDSFERGPSNASAELHTDIDVPPEVVPAPTLQGHVPAMVLQGQAASSEPIDYTAPPAAYVAVANLQGQAASSEPIDPLLLEAFAEESAELLDALHVELENLEQSPGDHGALLEIRRVVHTIKGGAKMCRFEHVVALTHAGENLLDLVADGARPLDTPALRALFACEPLLRSLVQDALAGQSVGADVGPAIELAAHFDALCASAIDSDHERYTDSNIAANNSVVVEDRADGAASAGVDVAIIEEGASIASSPRPVDPPEPSREEPREGASPPLTSPPRIGTASSTNVAAAPTTGGPERSGGRRGRESINVDLAKVDAVVAKVTEMAAHRSSYQGMVGQLMDTTGEARRNILRLQGLALSIGNECMSMQQARPARSQAKTEARAGRADDLGLESYNALGTLALQLQEAVADQQALIERLYDTITNHWSLRATESRVDADLQSALMNIRLIPLATMRVRLDGVVRQAAQATGKSVRWQLQGGNVAVEKNVFERLFEPLMHLLRNAVDHGLEGPEARRAAGKAETGVITVAVRGEDNHIVITVADDGAGIVPDKIAAVAVDRGVIDAARAATLSARQKTELIFTPGFSTAANVSHLSGRGVGMDAVREACLRMGGAIDVESRPGLGTTFTLRLPLSLSVTRGLIVRDGGCYMAVPVGQITALHLVPATDIVDAPASQGGDSGRMGRVAGVAGVAGVGRVARVARIEGHDLPVYTLPPFPGSTPAAYVQNDEVHVLQVPHEGGSLGLIIEDVLDEEEMLIKALPPLLRGVKTLLGSYVLPDGTVAPVINLPRLLADLRPAVTMRADQEETLERAPVALVVDDSMSMRVALSGTLQGAGFTVLTARDGQEALDVLKRESLPSIVMLDIEMPRMDGLETLFAIRQLPGAGPAELPVFMMTSRGGAKHRRAAEQLGATRYFTKPYRDSELAAAARAACAL